jgi:hypothetical protein
MFTSLVELGLKLGMAQCTYCQHESQISTSLQEGQDNGMAGTCLMDISASGVHTYHPAKPGRWDKVILSKPMVPTA